MHVIRRDHALNVMNDTGLDFKFIKKLEMNSKTATNRKKIKSGTLFAYNKHPLICFCKQNLKSPPQYSPNLSKFNLLVNKIKPLESVKYQSHFLIFYFASLITTRDG